MPRIVLGFPLRADFEFAAKRNIERPHASYSDRTRHLRVRGQEPLLAVEQECRPPRQGAAQPRDLAVGGRTPQHRPPPGPRPLGSRPTGYRTDGRLLLLRLQQGRARNHLHRRSGFSAGHLSASQELEELDTFAQPAPHHLRALYHLSDQRSDLAAAKVEPLVEGL
jgi:hypothetical protein